MRRLTAGCSGRYCSLSLKDALSDRASAIIVAHNHPAGSLEPSASDVEVTKQLKAAGGVMGIAVLDHIIFNRSAYFSFLEAGGCNRCLLGTEELPYS